MTVPARPRSEVVSVSIMRDRDIRAALHARLLAEHAEDLDSTRFVDELGLCGEVRVDIAVVNAALSGFELKSAADTLRRFPKQVDVYSRVLDYCTLVTAPSHLDHALEILPKWWGCVIVREGSESVSLDEVRPAKFNKKIDGYSLAQLLWRDEVLAALDSLDAARGCKSKPRAFLWLKLVEQTDIHELRDIVRNCLKRRERWRITSPSLA